MLLTFLHMWPIHSYLVHMNPIHSYLLHML